MAAQQRSINTRLTTEGAQRAAQDFERFGERGQQALKRIERASEETSRGLLAVDRASQTLGRGISLLYERFFSVNAIIATVGGSAGLGLVARSAVTTAVEISAMARQAGLGAETLQEMAHASERAKVSFDATVDGLKEMQLRADEFVVTSKGSGAEAFQRLGLSQSEVRERLQNPADLLEEIIGRVRELDRAAQIRILDELFGGTAGEQFIRFVDLGEEGIRRMRREARDLGLVLDDEVLRGAERVADQFAELASTAQTQFQGGFLERFTGEFENLSDLVKDPEFRDGIREIGAFFGGIARFAVENAETVGRTAAAITGLKAGGSLPLPPPARALTALGGAALGFYSPEVLESLVGKSQTLEEQLEAVRQKIAEVETEFASFEGDPAGRYAQAYERDIAALRQQEAAIQRTIQAEAQTAALRALHAEDRAEQERKAAEDAARALKLAQEQAQAEKERLAERKRALAQLADLEEANALIGLEGVARLEAERDQAIENHRARLERRVLTEEEFNQARLLEEEKFQKEKAEIERKEREKAEEERKRDEERAAKEREREAERRAEEQRRLQEREAERQAEIMRRPFENFLDGMQDSVTDFWERFYNGGVDSLSDLGAAAKQLFARFAAEWTSLQLFQGGAFGLGGGTAAAGLGRAAGGVPGFGGGMFDLGGLGGLLSGGGLGAGLPSWLGGASNVLPGPALPGMGPAGGGFFAPGFDLGGFSLGGVLQGAGLGFGAGSLLNGLIGGNAVGGTIGSGVGALAGAALGSIIPGVGTLLGGLLGGAGGGLLGGLFGPGKSVGPNSVGRLNIDNGRLRSGIVKADNGGDVAATRQFAEAVADQVNALLDSLGAEIGGLFSIGTFGGNFRAGRRYNGGRLERNLGSDPQAALQAATLFAFETSTLRGLDPALTAAVQQAAKISEDLEDFALNVGVARGILDETIFDEEELTQAEQALKALAEAFEDATERAERLGLSTDKLGDLYEQAQADLTEGFDQGIRRQILQLTDPLTAALEAQAEAAEQRLKEAKALGADLVEVERLNALERQRVLEQAGGDLRRFFEEITFGSLSGVSPGAGVEAQRAAFEAAAASGNVADLSRLGRGLLESARGAYASGPQYQEILARVQSVVGGYVAGNDNGSVAATLNEGFGQSITLYQQMLAELAAMRQELTALRQDNARLTSQLEAIAA
ncbi:MAG: hypothetical protein Kow00114_36040 [Kiloniellaceae bacterium]